MQSKGFIKWVAILLCLACLYELSFTFVSKRVESKAVEYAESEALTYAVSEAEWESVNVIKVKENPSAEEQAHVVAIERKDAEHKALLESKEKFYLDSMYNQKVYNLGLLSFTYKECKEKELNLGLDLKGGMNVMLEIQVGDVVKALAGDSVNDAHFAAALASTDKAVSEGDGDYIEILAETYNKESNGQPLANLFVSPDSKIKAGMSNEEVVSILKADAEAAIETSFEVINNRIDRFGVVQPNIQRVTGTNRIMVELPGVKDPERVEKLLEGAASLEFWTTYSGAKANDNRTLDVIIASLIKADGYVQEYNKAKGGDSEVAYRSLLDIIDLNYRGGAAVGAVSTADIETVNKYLALAEVRNCFPKDARLLWGIKPDKNANGKVLLYAISVERADGKAPLDGSAISDAEANYAQQGANAEVTMTMNANGMTEWAQITGKNVGKCIAIVLDGYVYSAPNVLGKIEGGNSSITGDFTIQEAEDLANILKSGKVPAPARVLHKEVVGPSLGQESINAGLISIALAFVLVLLYMAFFYRAAGLLADIALVVNIFLLIGCVVSLGSVLTLPGIAGIVLTMGMAVDANVIIFERIKEELRGGKGLHAAIKDGFANAYSAIIDGNLTTIITGIILFFLGTGPIKGFATTLIIGILTSLFTSIFITRMLIDRRVEKRGKLAFSFKWSENLLSDVKFDFVGKRFIAYIVSGVIILAGVISLSVKGLNLGVEFTGGDAYVVRFDKAVSVDEVRVALDQAFAENGADAANSSVEVKQYGSDNQVRIVTQYKPAEGGQTLEAILHGALKGFYGYDIALDQFSATDKDQNGIVSSVEIGPAIAKDMTTGAVWSIVTALIAIGLYIIFRFRKWQWAVGATVALAHDTFMIIALFSLLYSVMPFNLEVNQAFIAAILTIIGYSINDTVVIFDRIREFIGLYPKRDLKSTINSALASTMMRTLNTSGTTLVTLLAIFIFGGEAIQGFVFALIIGVVVGTYSSLFIASPLAYDMQSKKAKKAHQE
ncbi:MAG: protein translocase subunit SecDF [Alistipes sp.]|nr:protein translocase subunit SecDF [Alistipes sp.]